MIFTTRIACYGHKHLALDAAKNLFEDLGFEEAEFGDERVRYVNPRPLNVAAPSPLRFADSVTVRLAPDQVVLEADLSGVPRRTMVLSYTVGLVGMVLLLANYLWAEPMQPPLRALLPIAPWPLLIPMIHKNLNWNAKQRWSDFLRQIGCDAAVMAAQNTVETAADAAPPAPVETTEPELVEV